MKRVLFVCIHNSNRSQMAEAFARLFGGDRVEAHRAGSRPSGAVNAHAIEAMRESGYDLSRHRSKSLAEIPEGALDAVVTMGCGDACPSVPSAAREDWGIPGPQGMEPARHAEARELIRGRVRELLRRLLQRRAPPDR